MEITSEELLKLAKLSALTLKPEEIPLLQKQIQDILNYAQSVKEIATHAIPETADHQTTNRFRPDTIIPTPPQPLLAQAPEHAENFFVVPRILEG